MMYRIHIFLLAVMMGLTSGCVIQPIDGSKASSSGKFVQVDAASDTVQGEEAAGTIDIVPYQLKPMDPIYIRFSGIQDQQMLDIVIDEKGEISLLHINEPVLADGLTTSELEDKIERLYVEGGIYKSVSVNVTMTAKAYYVQGEVNAPGKFQLTSGTTLVQAIAEARGLTPFASKKVTVTRQGKIYTFNLNESQKKRPTLSVKRSV